MKILITGATGFIGTNLIKHLSSTHQITALIQNSSDISMIRQYCTSYRYDKKLEDLIDFIKNKQFDGVVHLATYYQPSHSTEDLNKMLHSNILFGTHLLEALSHCPPKFFINTMTFSQFANSNSYSPAGLYDATKQAFCDIMHFYSTKLSTIFCNLLLYNTYGNNDTRPKIFNLWSKIAKTQESLEMSLGEQKIDISHIDDIVEGFSTLINLCNQNKINNLSTFTLENKRYSLRELAEIFAQTTKSTLPIIWGAKPYRDNEIMNPISSENSDLLKLPNWEPKVSLRKGIKDVFAK